MTRKEKIQDAAADLFARKGYRETSMAELCKLTGVAEGTIFYHFGSKEDLFIDILDSMAKEIMSEFSGYIPTLRDESGLDQIRSIIAFYLHQAERLGSRYLLLHRHFSHELAQANPTCRKLLEGLYGMFLDSIEGALRQGMADGSIRDVSPHKMAFLLFALLDGVVRLQTFNLYNSESLYDELMTMVRFMFSTHNTNGE